MVLYGYNESQLKRPFFAGPREFVITEFVCSSNRLKFLLWEKPFKVHYEITEENRITSIFVDKNSWNPV